MGGDAAWLHGFGNSSNLGALNPALDLICRVQMIRPPWVCLHHIGTPIDGAGLERDLRRTTGPGVLRQAKLPPGGHADLHKGIMKVQD